MQAPIVTTFEQMHVSSRVGHELEAQVMAHAGTTGVEVADCAEAKPATKAIAAIDKDFMMDDVRDVKVT